MPQAPGTCETIPRYFTDLLTLFIFILLLLLVVYLIASVLGHLLGAHGRFTLHIVKHLQF
jgi:hypothetical protein